MPLLQKAVNTWLKENMTKIRSPWFEETLRHSAVFLEKYPEYKDTKVWPEEPELLGRVEDDRWEHDYNKMIEISQPFRRTDRRIPQLVRPSFLEAGPDNDGGVPVWGLADNCRVPKHTLQGPWTEDKVRYLCWLVRAGATIDYHNSTSGEVRPSLRSSVKVSINRSVGSKTRLSGCHIRKELPSYISAYLSRGPRSAPR